MCSCVLEVFIGIVLYYLKCCFWLNLIRVMLVLFLEIRWVSEETAGLLPRVIYCWFIIKIDVVIE